MITAIFLGKLTGCIPGVVVKIRHETKHFVFFQLFHGFWQLGIQSATPYVAVDGVQSLLVDLLQRMISRRSPLCPAFRITDLPTGAVQFVPRRKATSVFGMLCVGGQDPFLEDTAFLRYVSHISLQTGFPFFETTEKIIFLDFLAHTFYFAGNKWYIFILSKKFADGWLCFIPQLLLSLKSYAFEDLFAWRAA